MFKKLISVLLCMLILSSLFSSSLTFIAVETDETDILTENNNETETQPETPEPIIITVGVITEPGSVKTGVNVRKDAGTTTDKVYLINDGTSVTVLGSKDDINFKKNEATQKTFVWYNITFMADGVTYTGYVREDMIKVTTHTYTPPTEEDETPIVVKPFEEQLAEFPENYHSYLIALHEKYPNWIFTADNISLTYSEAIALESIFPRKLVENQYYSWRSMDENCFNWSTGTYAVTDGRWYGASREVIAFYMDPRNFLNTSDAYIFMKQSYDPESQNLSGLRELLKGRFLENKYADVNDMLYGGDYAYVIMEAAKVSGVSPYILASTIIQEQGSNGTVFTDGSLTYNGVTVYNFFNMGVSGTTEADKRANGAKFAYNMGWTTRSAAIIGGAQRYANGYVNSNPSNPYYNQDTYFYKNYNILNPSQIYHQYAQNVADQVSSAAILRKLYTENTTTYLTFRIPVYKNNSLPEKAAVAPEKNMNQNNYYLNGIEVDGLTPSFSRYLYSYALQVEEDTLIYINKPETASIDSPMTYNLTAGENTITIIVKSATGYTNNYVINVNAVKDCIITITTEKPEPPPPEVEEDNPTDPDDPNEGDNGEEGDDNDPNNPGDNDEPDTPVTPEPPAPTYVKGDANGDGNITLSDLAAIRIHLLEISLLTEDNLLAADINGDGEITLSDLAAVRLHLLGIIVIE